MTNREACQQIVADGNCRNVDCGHCPLFDMERDCDNMDEVTMAKSWLRLNPCNKVFSRKKYLLNGQSPDRDTFEWPYECEGKTKKECNELGYIIRDSWMEER